MASPTSVQIWLRNNEPACTSCAAALPCYSAGIFMAMTSQQEQKHPSNLYRYIPYYVPYIFFYILHK
ncbi:hypothetical protein Tsubulata_027515 [Turnera subulata]|uniref:Uncharacterized protein n=1 Tax=Turnera subulata TaxID=218843 RepID=A0A9Q0G802_9ROSI|nr:hypothetical protein Tsubulata_027515 [Turnera subulata]